MSEEQRQRNESNQRETNFLKTNWQSMLNPQEDEVTTNFNETVHQTESERFNEQNVNDAPARLSVQKREPDVETATDVTPILPNANERRREMQGRENEEASPVNEGMGISGRALGWAGLVLSILAFFVYPILFGIVGVALGFFGYRQGAQTLGIWSMVLGGLAIIGSMLFSPYFLR